MKIPKTIKIGGHNFEVIIDNRNRGGSNDIGSCCHTEGKIYLEENVNQSTKESTLFHEIIEAINYIYELDLDHNKITVLEATLYQVLKDNDLIK